MFLLSDCAIQLSMFYSTQLTLFQTNSTSSFQDRLEHNTGDVTLPFQENNVVNVIEVLYVFFFGCNCK